MLNRDVLAVAARLALGCLVLSCAACSTVPPPVQPLARWSPEHNAQVREMMAGGRSKDIAILLAFSGGGTRAAAFSYGVLKELNRTHIRTQRGIRSLLQEVDMISAVSGGSFTAAYYGLYGEQIFESFEQRFLRQDVQGELVSRAINPTNWRRLGSPAYGRADLAAEYYDEILFGGAPISALERPNAPRVVINSTDLVSGERIPFLQEMFDLFCIDLDSFPVSRAVTASSAVPLLFSPIALQSYAGTCGFEEPAWVEAALQKEQITSEKIVARSVREYLDRNRRPWLHLVDGGISDNLGLRSYYRTLTITDKAGPSSNLLPHLHSQHVLVVLVNAHSHPHREWALVQKPPPLFQVAGSVSGSQIVRYSEDTILLTRQIFENWVEENTTPERPLSFNFVEVGFNRVKDPGEREYLNGIGTTFRLTDNEVDRLIAAGQAVLAQSKEYQDFVRIVRGFE